MNTRLIPVLWLAAAAALAGNEAPRTIVELQPLRESSSIPIRSRAGREGTATLINLNPAINAWYLLKVAWKDGRAETTYHLENANPRSARILPGENGLVITEGRDRHPCDLFSSDSANALDQGRASPVVFYPLCEGRIYLRNAAVGHRTTLEAATDFLREHVWGGEKIISLGHFVMGDMHRESGTLETGSPAAAPRPAAGDLPLAALIDSRYSGKLLGSFNLGIDLEGPARTGLTPGAWYPAEGNPGIYVSILQPNLIDPGILASYRNQVSSLDGIEASALCFLVAFDLDSFELGYALGTEHPKVGWSDHILPQMKDPALPGPDGIGTISPLVATGLLSPKQAAATVSTFTAGFKRTHGAFKSGDLALRNRGSHYGFIENGVVFSKLQPGLSTVFVLADGSLGMKTWTEADDALLAKIRHARQNGVPILDSGVPGSLVNNWGAGNWSGSGEGRLRTMRSGAALQTSGRRRFLIYAVFSDATPSAMARVFQAYRCDYAMLLDMNALEHTYLAVYRRSGSGMFVDHLIKGMNVLEKSAAGELVPRFLGYADNRDFFYVMRREARP
ncbi:MAG TPA: hypothetical protein VEF06_03385 [Bryobacteraceae bacterium]|nr:hypothetical protein [Bryobacteraceae bacterium]